MPEGGPSAADVRDAEAWFGANGLPYFVDRTRARVRRGLRPSRVLAVVLLGVLAGALVAWWAGRTTVLLSVQLSSGLQALLVVLALYAWTALGAGAVTGWAARQAVGGLGLLFPLVTRALPLLLLFITFLFINTEVWMVAERLDGGVMWLVVLLFGAVSVAFLLARLPEEVRSLDDGLDADRVSGACAGTPLEPWVDLDDSAGIDEPLDRIETGNLVLVLLVSQAVQVLLLSLSVFAFFLLFGAVTMDAHVIEAWIGHEPTPVLGQSLVNRELVQVATFLAAFSGLYFTVYAVTDEAYRGQFFTEITGELERAVSAREVYRAMVRRTTNA